jgi:hypothetical protein
MKLLDELSQKGIRLAPKLSFEMDRGELDVETLALLQANKPDLLRALAAPDAIPPLPWELVRLLKAAGSTEFKADLRQKVDNIQAYTLSWGCAYVTGDREHALRRLWEVYEAWQEVNAR